MDVSIASGTCTTPCRYVVVGLVGSTYFSCRSYSRYTRSPANTASLRICYISSNVCHALSPLPFLAVFAHVRVCARARECASPPCIYRTSVYTRDLVVEAREDRRRETGPDLAIRVCVFGGLRIVWISNDCAEPVRACDDVCLRTRRDFPGQVTYRRFTTRCIVSFFLSLSLFLSFQLDIIQFRFGKIRLHRVSHV